MAVFPEGTRGAQLEVHVVENDGGSLAVDLCLEALEKQLVKYKEKQRSK